VSPKYESKTLSSTPSSGVATVAEGTIVSGATGEVVVARSSEVGTDADKGANGFSGARGFHDANGVRPLRTGGYDDFSSHWDKVLVPYDDSPPLKLIWLLSTNKKDVSKL
jgi:hypothetical protein